MLALTPAVDESIPLRFYNRPSFEKSRRLLLVKWLMMANILSHAYKGALLSSLVTIQYTEPLDTIDQMVESGLPFYIPKGSALVWLAKTDPRNSVKMLNERHVVFPFDGKLGEEDLQKYKMLIFQF